MSQKPDISEGEDLHNLGLRLLNHTIDRAEEAEAALNRVRELHQRIQVAVPVCSECADREGDFEEWPCNTIRAIDTTEETPDE